MCGCPDLTIIVTQSVSIMPGGINIAHSTPPLKQVNQLIGLAFLSKIVFKHLDGQITVYDDEHNLSEDFQSV